MLLDSFCNEFVEYAFFLFQFLFKDQSSQYYPVGKVKFYSHVLVIIYLYHKLILIVLHS